MSLRTFAALVSFAVTVAGAARAQSTLRWYRYHDGPQTQADFGRQCAVDAAGNVYVSGRSYNPSAAGIPPPPPQADFELVMYDADGFEQWTDRYDAFGSEDFPLDIQRSPAGDVYVAGYGWNGNDIDLVLMKYTASGRAWVQTYAGAGGGSDWGRAIGFDAAGNVVVVGNEYDPTTNNDALARCWTPGGTPLWTTRFDGGAALADTLYAIVTLPSGELLVAGQLGVGASQDLALVKLSASGAFAWQRTLDGGAGLADAATALTLVGTDKVVLGGYRATASSGEDWLIAQYDHVSASFGWSRTFDGSAHGNDRVRSLACDARGVTWVSGSATGAGSGVDCVTRRYDASGTLQSSHTWNNASANLDDQPFRVLLGSAGQAWVCGYTTQTSAPFTTDALVLQYDTSGALNWAGTYSSPGAFDDRVFDADLAPNDRIALAGYTNSGPSGGYDYMALSVDLGPSPQGYCTAKLNSLGCTAQLVFTGMPSAAASSAFVLSTADLRNQQNGLYFYSASSAAANPFQGGYLCMLAPLERAPLANTGGTALPTNDCSGVCSLDFNAFAHGLLGGVPSPALLSVGARIHSQFWSRDPGASFTTNLSSALGWVVLP